MGVVAEVAVHGERRVGREGALAGRAKRDDEASHRTSPEGRHEREDGEKFELNMPSVLAARPKAASARPEGAWHIYIQVEYGGGMVKEF